MARIPSLTQSLSLAGGVPSYRGGTHGILPTSNYHLAVFLVLSSQLFTAG